MDEAKLAEQITRANHASMLLNDELFREVVNKARENLIAQWIMSQDDERDRRERLYQQVHLIDTIVHDMKIIAGKGAQAQHDLQELQINPTFSVA